MSTPEAFRALARSSPWRWRSLRFVRRAPGPWPLEPVRAWIRRPGAMRVETLGGELLTAVADDATPGLWWPREAAPVLRPDGLVARRAFHPDGETWDDPMYQSYTWVAVLDPCELADGVDDGAPTEQPPVVLSELAEVVHHGRPAWEAVLRSTGTYEPRCSCCALLLTPAIERDQPDYPDRTPGFAYPDAHRVRLDVGTGVCVRVEAIGGSAPGPTLHVEIEAVDEELPDALFELRRRRLSWRAGPR